MHSKMRLRVNMMELIIKQARRDEDDKEKVAKEKHGGNQNDDANDTKRKEEVFKFK